MRICVTCVLSLLAQYGASVVLAEEPESWRKLQIRLAVAESHLQSGNFEAALHEFVMEDGMELFEVPSYKALLGIAEAKCRLGEAEPGLVDLASFVWAVRVDTGELPWWRTASPDGSLVVGMKVMVDRLGGDVTSVVVFPTDDSRRMKDIEQELLFKVHGCTILYVFWLDNERAVGDPARPFEP